MSGNCRSKKPELERSSPTEDSDQGLPGGRPSPRRGIRGEIIACATALALIGLVGGGCGGSEAPAPDEVTGTWIGQGAGFVDGSPRKGLQERLVIKEPVGRAFAGTAEWRVGDGKWSEPETIHGTIETDGEVLIIDGDGFLIGHLDGDEMELSYLEHDRVGGGGDYAIDYALRRVEVGAN